MQRLAIVAVLVLAASACTRADETSADTSLPAMAPAPTTTPLDTGLKVDTTRRDTTKAGATSATKGTKGTKRP